MGLYRAAANLAYAMQLDMVEAPAFELSDNGLRKRILRARNGYEVRYDIDKSDREELSSSSKEKRIKQQGLLLQLKRVIARAVSKVASSVLINEWRRVWKSR